jgi:hypothetical protein
VDETSSEESSEESSEASLDEVYIKGAEYLYNRDTDEITDPETGKIIGLNSQSHAASYPAVKRYL